MATEVRYKLGTTLIGTGTVAPDYAFDWTNAPAGSHEITAELYVDGVLHSSDVVNVTVSSVPGTITYDALWSLDKIENPSYSGPSIQVSYDNGATFTDIGFVGDELDVAGLESIPNVAVINKIYDKSGNGNDLVFDAGSRPVIKGQSMAVESKGGRPAIKFSEGTTDLKAPATLTAENGLSLFIVHHNDTTTGSNKGIVGKWGGTGNEYAVLSRHFASPNDVSFISQDSGSVQQNMQSGTTLTTKATRLITALYDSETSTKSFRINGTEVGSTTANIRASDAPFQVGGYAGDTNEAMWVSEIRLKKVFISDFATIEAAIKTKFGIV